jgi:Flp pilus assembly protein CpaB
VPHILVALAAVLAFGLNFLALQSREATTLVVVADGAIAEGTALTADLVRTVPLPSDFEGLGHLIVGADLDRLHGWIVSRSVADGELVDRSIVIRPGANDGLRTMSIPVPVEHAVGATLVVSDRVDVISVIDGQPSFVAEDLEVVSIATSSQGGLSGVGPYHIVVAVTSDEALALAKAIDDGSIEVVRSTGALLSAGDAS